MSQQTQEQTLMDEQLAEVLQATEHAAQKKKEAKENDDAEDADEGDIVINIPNPPNNPGYIDCFWLSVEDNVYKKIVDVEVFISAAQRSKYFGGINLEQYVDLRAVRYSFDLAMRRQDEASVKVIAGILRDWVAITNTFAKLKTQFSNPKYDNSEQNFEIVCKGLTAELNRMESCMIVVMNSKDVNADFKKECRALLTKYFLHRATETPGQTKIQKNEKKSSNDNSGSAVSLPRSSLSSVMRKISGDGGMSMSSSSSTPKISARPKILRLSESSIMKAIGQGKKNEGAENPKAPLFDSKLEPKDSEEQDLQAHDSRFFAQRVDIDFYNIGAKAEEKQNTTEAIKTIEVEIRNSSAQDAQIHHYNIGVPSFLWNRCCRKVNFNSQSNLKNSLSMYQNAINQHEVKTIGIALADIHDCIVMLLELHGDSQMPDSSIIKKIHEQLCEELHRRLRMLEPSVSGLNLEDLASLYLQIQSKDIVATELAKYYPGLKPFLQAAQPQSGVQNGVS